MRRLQVASKVGHPLGILEEGAVHGRRIRKRRAVLGDVERDRAVPVAHPSEDVRESGRVDLPVHIGVRAVRLTHASSPGRERGRVGPDDTARVVVDAQEIDRPSNGGGLLHRGVRPRVAVHGAERLGVDTEEHRVEVLSVEVRVRAVGRRAISFIERRWRLRFQVDDEPDLVAAGRAVGIHGCRVRAQEVMRDARGLGEARMPGRQHAAHIPAVRHDPWLVEGHPQVHAIVEGAHDDIGVVGEPGGTIGVQPSAVILERGRQIPVVERDDRLYV